MPRLVGYLIGLALITNGGQAQTNPVADQFTRLMGMPKQLTDMLVAYPWRTDIPTELPGLIRVEHGTKIRLASSERPLSAFTSWKRWESEDGSAWVDVVVFKEAYDANETIQSARQPHSGYIWANQLLLFSGTADRQKDALGAAVATTGGALLNVGLRLPLEVHWDRPLSEADRILFDAALTRFQSMLETLARAFLDPEYTSFGAKIETKPEAVKMLRMAGFARLWSYIKYNFVYLDWRPGLNWDGILEQYLPRIAAARSDADYGKLLQQAVALLKDGHTNVYPNVADPRDAPAILLEPIGGRPVATIVGTLAELDQIKPGMELLEIDGRPVHEIIQRELDPYIASSTTQDRELREMRLLLQGEPGSLVKTKWRTLDERTIEVAIRRNGTEHRSALKIPNRSRFEHKQLVGDVAYVGLNTFDDPRVEADFAAKFNEIRGAKAWIIDLRHNGGGSSDIGYKILARFIDVTMEGSKQSTRLYNATLAARRQPQTWYEWPSDKIEPATGPRFHGPVYVLTSPETCSAAEDFLIPLKMYKRAIIVGEPSCGSTGQPLPFSIYGATARVCTKWDRFPDGTEFVGVGVLPDVKAVRTREDVAIGRDAVLDAAIGLATTGHI